MQIKALTLFMTVTFLTGCAGMTPELGVKNGKLTACPATPNCVSSQADDPLHAVKPLVISGTTPEVKARLLRVLAELDRSKVVHEQDDYIAAEVTSRIFRFVDDVEFYFPATTSTETVVHIRSASRVGFSDLGVNQKRVELIRDRLKSDTQ